MSAYYRTTRECTVSELHPVLLQAIRNYFQERALGDPETGILMCCETISKKKNTGKLASWLSGEADTTIYLGMLLTSQWLVWVHHGDQSGTLLNAASLKLIRADYYSSTLPRDVGLEITGYVVDAKGGVRGYVAMGAGPVTQKFCEEVKQAIFKVNPPVKRTFFGIPLG